MSQADQNSSNVPYQTQQQLQDSVNNEINKKVEGEPNNFDLLREIVVFLQFFLDLPLAAVWLIIFLLLFVPIFQDYGVDKLVWHEEELKQFAVGFGIGLVLYTTIFFSYVFRFSRSRSMGNDIKDRSDKLGEHFNGYVRTMISGLIVLMILFILLPKTIFCLNLSNLDCSIEKYKKYELLIFNERFIFLMSAIFLFFTLTSKTMRERFNYKYLLILIFIIISLVFVTEYFVLSEIREWGYKNLVNRSCEIDDHRVNKVSMWLSEPTCPLFLPLGIYLSLIIAHSITKHLIPFLLSKYLLIHALKSYNSSAWLHRFSFKLPSGSLTRLIPPRSELLGWIALVFIWLLAICTIVIRRRDNQNDTNLLIMYGLLWAINFVWLIFAHRVDFSCSQVKAGKSVNKSIMGNHTVIWYCVFFAINLCVTLMATFFTLSLITAKLAYDTTETINYIYINIITIVFIVLTVCLVRLDPDAWGLIKRQLPDRSQQFDTPVGIFAILVYILFALLSFIPLTGSPLVFFMGFTFVLLVLYYLACRWFGAAKILLLAVALTLIFISSYNKYKYQFGDPLKDKYRQILNLEDEIKNSDAYKDCKNEIDQTNLQNALFWHLLSEFLKSQVKYVVENEADHYYELISICDDKVRSFTERLQQCAEKRIIRPHIYPKRILDQIESNNLNKTDRRDHVKLLNTQDIKWKLKCNCECSSKDCQSKESGCKEKCTCKTKKPLILVTVTGGGLRAAVWSHLILQKLEEEFASAGYDFPGHVRLITGASGGMLGAAYYVSKLRSPNDQPRGKKRFQNPTESSCSVKLGSDYITPIMKQYLYADLPNLLSPWSNNFDRGQMLEKAWSKHLDEALDCTFKSLSEGEREGWRPSLVFTPMMIEDGRRLIISNLNMYYPTSHDGPLIGGRQSLIRHHIANGNKLCSGLNQYENNWANLQEVVLEEWNKELALHGLRGDKPHTVTAADLTGSNYSIEAFEFFKLFPDLHEDSRNGFKISTATRMSAAFPFFTPSVSLPTTPRRRVIDAGFYDNYGVSLSATWLCSKSNRQWIQENVDRICLIQIQDGQYNALRRLEKIEGEKSNPWSRALEEILSPLEGLDNARMASSAFRNDGQLEIVGDYMEMISPPNTRINFMVVNFAYPGHACMNWRLTQCEMKDLKEWANKPDVHNRIQYLMNYLFDTKPILKCP